jgi:putative membrane protein
MQASLGVTALVHLLLTGVSVVLVGWLTPGIRVKSLGHAVLFSTLVALLNALLWSKLGALPQIPQALSSGLGSLALNGLVFYAVGKVSPGIEVSGCISAAAGAFLVSLLNGLLYATLRGALAG